MKIKSVVLIFLFSFIFLSSCNDDPKIKTNIVGTWISDDGNYLYSFDKDGKGYYICVPDNETKDDCPYEYTIDQDVLELSYLNNKEGYKDRFRIIISNDNESLKMQLIGEFSPREDKWTEYKNGFWRNFHKF